MREPDNKHYDKLDIIVFGVTGFTGFTGKLVCEYLSKTYDKDKNILWGNRDKLNALQLNWALSIFPCLSSTLKAGLHWTLWRAPAKWC